MDSANVPTDTYLALELLTEECAILEYASVMLKTQIYTLVPDKTTVEAELDALRQSGKIRLFQLPTDRNDVAILLSTEHDADITSIARSRSLHESQILLKSGSRLTSTRSSFAWA